VLTLRLTHRRRAILAASAALALSLAACRPGWDALGTSPAQAQANGVALTDGLTKRFTAVERTPFYAAARAKLAKRTLSPTLVFDDTTAWTSRPDEKTRILMAEGVVTPDAKYRFTERVNAPYPDRPADSRHVTQLTKLAGAEEFEWRATVDFAIGSMTPTDWTTAFRALLASAEGRSDADLRADVRSTMRRTSVALGRLFSLDTLHAQRLADGSTALTIGMRVHPDWLKPEFPLFAKFVGKYVAPAAYRITLRDARGIRWMDISAGNRNLVIQMRVLHGGVIALDGPTVTQMPDTLRLSMNASTRFAIFSIGFRGMEGIVTAVRSASERSWVVRFNHAPEWQLPLFAASMLKTPLRRPFEQGGASLKFGFRVGAGGQTSISRETRVAVQESAISRFLGGFSSSAFSEFDGPAEREENRFNAEVYGAMRDDLKALRYGNVAP
jgi:hypothetical protein